MKQSFLVIVNFSFVVHGLLFVQDEGRRGVNATRYLPKKIWMFWEGPEQPELNKLCIRMWKDLNPGWEHTVIDDKLVKETFPELAQTFEEIPRNVAHKADMVRLQWLAKFGGVWADASVLPIMPLDSFVRNLVAPSGFFGYHCESYCDIFPYVASWFLVAEPANRLVVAWRDELLKRWRGDAPRSEEAKTPDERVWGEPSWAYYEIGHALAKVIEESVPVRDVYSRMPIVSADWPEQCNMGDEASGDGCLTFWKELSSSNRPPMLKRPGVMNNEEWLNSYHGMVTAVNRTKSLASVGPKTWDRKAWVKKYLAAIRAKRHQSLEHMRSAGKSTSFSIWARFGNTSRLASG